MNYKRLLEITKLHELRQALEIALVYELRIICGIRNKSLL